MNDELNVRQKVGVFVKDSLLAIILVLSLIAFALKEVILLKPSEEFDWYRVVASGIITYIFAVYVYVVLGELGIKKGKNSNQFQSTMQDLSKSKNDIVMFVDKLPIFVAYKNRQALKEVRTNILSECAMTYERFENGYYKKHYDELSDLEKQAFNMATNIRIKLITARDLLSENTMKEKFALSKKKRYEVRYNPLKMGRTEEQFAASRVAKKLFTKLIYPFLFSYLTIQSIVWGNLLYGCIQAILILLGGSINYISSEDYVINELRNRFISKADFLKEFKVMYDNNDAIFNNELVEVVEERKVNEERKIDLNECIRMDQLVFRNEETCDCI